MQNDKQQRLSSVSMRGARCQKAYGRNSKKRVCTDICAKEKRGELREKARERDRWREKQEEESNDR